MGKLSRDKGANYERELVNAFKDRGLASQRVPLSGATSYAKNDIEVADENFVWAEYDGKALAYLAFLTLGFSFVSLFATVYLLRQVGTVHATSVWFVVPLCSLVLMYHLRLVPLPGLGGAVLQLLGCALVLTAMAAPLAALD